MDISQFDYDLPAELIAQVPSLKRDRSRLLILNRQSETRKIKPFHSVVDYLREGDALVVNNTKVFKARLFGKRTTGGKVELFLVRPDSIEGQTDRNRQCRWLALMSPSRRLKEGERVLFGEDTVMLEKDVTGGVWRVKFDSISAMQRIVRTHGHVPLPQYIKRDDSPSDIRRYQTIFANADRVGAVAAPTAGFHFTKSIMKTLRAIGVELIELTLHVGPGTFKPVSVDQIEDHSVDPEFAELTSDAARKINRIKKSGGRLFAVGTTSVRTLESASYTNGTIQPYSGMVDLYIRPGYDFKVVDHLITNFHLPKSSLLILVSAFAGSEKIMDAYQHAIREKLRFYSYGDAMLIL